MTKPSNEAITSQAKGTLRFAGSGTVNAAIGEGKAPDLFANRCKWLRHSEFR